ncbi:uncharacterized protein CIMG_11562 [Coccidioides immitis RS]|uniref:DNA replication regulator SLD2 n=3 Tax=Coccidioides immitis TaxID=5501 RepID=A0A0D8JW96_COCIM|nr:uncharacterized protein CIMG_11562 [Coccidioides immitis RS]KJF61186.1 hypothetical protein CIMG_11562 [Coccidioides immitis RS]KMP05652.1 hypothetical protein CIRG_05333 [Coccidioides immitis RMSCC 2394]KMU86883.1 hypothetical protein CIHG_04822 [Coccidioides immitis H538.4]TPX21928.1 DNA replication regulator sld2 [Coccidioides immitis]
MATSAGSPIEQQLASLRSELKEWEKAFSDANEGRKATREDIKKDAAIAAKYKTYSRLRSQKPSSCLDRSTTDHNAISPARSQKKRTYPFTDSLAGHESCAFATPRKVAKHTSAPQHPSHLDPYESPPNVRRLLSPNEPNISPIPLRAAIGPTPQRDGKVLGLFDLLSPSSPNTAAPSSRQKQSTLIDATATPSPTKKMQTPSRDHGSAIRPRRYSLTPVSSAKKFYLSKFFGTPSTMRYATIIEADEGNANVGDEVASPAQPTPSRKTNGSELETPTFLRRRSVLFPRTTNNGKGKINTTSPIAVRMPQKVVGKGLSQLVQGLRDLEDEMIQDDMDALREAEAADAEAGKVFVKDSQVPDSNLDAPDPTNTPSKPERYWKKKGQKRTTRLVYMRPVRAKPRQAPEFAIPEEDSEDELATAAESQGPFSAGGDNLDSEDEGNTRSKDKNNQGGKAKQSENKFVQKVRKIKAAAHANYRALKIRSKNGGGKGRFGRRR